ncbi:2-dehydro-3-deoxygluconokinase [Pullulanibacillus pueri]|uniref:2-dehydro-3-deoxygluconokinase n=1 Tax=Pullulanibacillus pueri TaxID=1437324 RepID=A0A8J3EKP9_9BACL|nr:sugar kinase [Pullulanibacillus pueri]MBM7681855.1 2-dehydro-3-deoxygluconokinase [Pullulanibacillus pueri]GGH76356.1 2-dehydro-3-deoxygluconokinase [Pullulanibacillus pueri]
MSKKIAAFGEVMMRLQVPGYESLSQASTLNYTFSGTGVNVTSALARLGHHGYLITRLPENALGDAAFSYIQKLGISPEFIKCGGEQLGLYFLENGYGPRQSRVTYTNRQLSSFNTAPIDLYPFEEIAVTMDMVHFCGIALAMNDRVRENMKQLAEATKMAGGMVVFDCNYRPSLWGKEGYEKAKPHYERMLYLADMVMMNEKDARWILGMETEKESQEEQLLDLIPRVAKKYSISTIAGTHRSIYPNHSHSLRGYIFQQGSFQFSKMLTFSVLDRIGAGDAFTSGILHGIIQGFSLEKTVTFAATSSMLAHTVVGDTPTATEKEILRAMTMTATDVER